MSNWKIEFSPEASKDFDKLDGSQKELVAKAIKKTSQNPLPESEGGYGKPLGNHKDSKLAGCLKIKLKKSGIRIVYKLVRIENEMYIIVIGMRDDSEVYKEAEKRANR